MQEKVAVNAPQIRSAALSMCCNSRNVCISKNEIFGILPQLKFGWLFPYPAIHSERTDSCHCKCPGPICRKRKKTKAAFGAKAFSVKKVILWEAFLSITVLMPFLNKTLHDYGIAYLHITLICKILYEFLVFGF